MSIYCQSKNARFWVVSVLIAFVTQAMSAGVYAHLDEMNVPQMSGGCHDNVSLLVSDSETLNEDNEKKTCCEKGCQMQNCHPLSVMLSSFKVLILSSFGELSFLQNQASASTFPQSLYRPPILS